jgi:hypothetical protein
MRYPSRSPRRDFSSSSRRSARLEGEGSSRCSAPKPYLYAEELAAVTPWSVEAIRKMTARGVLKLGVHCFQPGGAGSRVIYKWETIREMIEGRDRERLEKPEPVPRRPRKVELDVEEATARLRSLLS